MSKKHHILVVDDETEMLVSCRKILQSERYAVSTAERGKQALSLIDHNHYDLLICDLRLPDMDGLEVLEECKKRSPDTFVIFITAFGTIDVAVESIKGGAFHFLEKPFTYERLVEVVKQAIILRSSRLTKQDIDESLKNKKHFGNIIGDSTPMQHIFDMISRISTTDSNIMIVGESGTGKELVAQSIHSHSLRTSKPFVPVNCGALPEQIFESELFGHEKGSYTGADSTKIGLFEFANGGTFFLDEVCTLSPALQVKLLRVIQEKRIRRVGGKELIDVDIRLISASNIDPDQALKDGLMREDLYYRLKVITINMPPLRDRIEDIPLLCSHFLSKHLKLNPRKQVRGFAPETLPLLQNYAWPGNVRELQNVVESALALSRGETITPNDLPDHLVCHRKILRPLLNVPMKQAKEKLIESFEREYLLNALEEQNWNISATARHCDIDRRTLQRLMKRFHIFRRNDVDNRGMAAAQKLE